MAKRRKRSLFRPIIKIIFSLALICIATYFIIHFFEKPAHIKYPAFGIDIPQGFLIHGIDVSRYQQVINWDDVKNMEVKDIKVGFVFIKATEGIGKIDAQFRRNWLETDDKELPKGAYHFFIPGKSGKAQAGNFIETVKLKTGDLPPVVDIESDFNIEGKEIRHELNDCLQRMEDYYKTKPIIYTNVDFYNNYLKDSFENYSFWIAHYQQPDKPRFNGKWLFWQHNESGRINGIGSSVDFNVFNGDSTEFKNLLLK